MSGCERKPTVLPILLLFGYALMWFASNALSEMRDMTFVTVTQRTVADCTALTFGHSHWLTRRARKFSAA